MTEMAAHVEASGEHAMTERDLCIAVGEDLQRMYPGHPWMVGANVQAGTIIIDLGYPKPSHLQNHAYLLHGRSLTSAGGQDKVRRAGGELLERFGIARGAATAESAAQAREHGLDDANAILKSRS